MTTKNLYNSQVNKSFRQTISNIGTLYVDFTCAVYLENNINRFHFVTKLNS